MYLYDRWKPRKNLTYPTWDDLAPNLTAPTLFDVPIPSVISPDIGTNTIYMIPPRRWDDRKQEWEPLVEWAKRCAVIKNVKPDTSTGTTNSR